MSEERIPSGIRIRALAVALGVALLSSGSSAKDGQALLGKAYPPQIVKQALLSRQEWHPFPTRDERPAWTSLPEATRQVLIHRGEAGLDYEWPALPATLFLEYARTGNRRNYQKQRSARRNMLCNLVIAECVEGQGRFLDDIANGVWAICEESYWGVPAHLYMQKQGRGLPDVTEPTVDLFAGETASLLAWTCYLLGPQLDRVSPLIRQRIEHEMQRRILTPCLERDDFWWMGFTSDHVNNWNPWCNSNWLTAALLMESDESRRLAAVQKIMKSLDRFIANYPADGGCDEGPGYWNRAAASLFDCLELLYGATDGAIDIYGEPLIREMGRYIYRVHINDRYFINFADAPAKVDIAADLAYRYGRRIGDDRLMKFAAFSARRQRATGRGLSGSLGRQLPAIFNSSNLESAEPAQPLLRQVWLKDTQVMAARSEAGSAKGLYLAAKGGHNAESHNHNDVGNFIVYMDGQPMIIDVGVETYTAKTFSRQRYDIWTMQSQFHNLPTVNGVMQRAGREFAARRVTCTLNDASAELELDIAGAYPPKAGVRSWVRTMRLERGKEIRVVDAYELESAPRDLTLSLMTPCAVTQDAPGRLTLQARPSGDDTPGASVHVYYDASTLAVELEKIAVEDRKLKSVWGTHITRILLQANAPSLHDTWTLRIAPL